MTTSINPAKKDDSKTIEYYTIYNSGIWREIYNGKSYNYTNACIWISIRDFLYYECNIKKTITELRQEVKFPGGENDDFNFFDPNHTQSLIYLGKKYKLDIHLYTKQNTKEILDNNGDVIQTLLINWDNEKKQITKLNFASDNLTKEDDRKQIKTLHIFGTRAHFEPIIYKRYPSEKHDVIFMPNFGDLYDQKKITGRQIRGVDATISINGNEMKLRPFIAIFNQNVSSSSSASELTKEQPKSLITQSQPKQTEIPQNKIKQEVNDIEKTLSSYNADKLSFEKSFQKIVAGNYDNKTKQVMVKSLLTNKYGTFPNVKIYREYLQKNIDQMKSQIEKHKKGTSTKILQQTQTDSDSNLQKTIKQSEETKKIKDLARKQADKINNLKSQIENTNNDLVKSVESSIEFDKKIIDLDQKYANILGKNMTQKQMNEEIKKILPKEYKSVEDYGTFLKQKLTQINNNIRIYETSLESLRNELANYGIQAGGNINNCLSQYKMNKQMYLLLTKL